MVDVAACKAKEGQGFCEMLVDYMGWLISMRDEDGK
jgi:hypothetical protein